MTRYEQFVADAQELSLDDYRKSISGNGGFDYNEQVKMLTKLQNKLNTLMLVYLFGEQLGCHYSDVFLQSGRNLLNLFARMDREAQFFILHELKTNMYLFSNH